ncbi:MAG: hypothetical protein ACE5JB_08210 [bacterium]
MRTKIVPIICFAICSLYSSLNAGTLRQQLDKTFEFEKGGKLILRNTNGNIKLESWNRDEIKGEAEKIVKAKSLRRTEEIMKEVRIEIEHDIDYLEIQTHIPRYPNEFWDSIFRGGVSISVNYHLIVPNNLKLDISTVNGGIKILA